MKPESHKPKLPEKNAVQKHREAFRKKKKSLKPSEELMKIIDRARKESEATANNEVERKIAYPNRPDFEQL